MSGKFEGYVAVYQSNKYTNCFMLRAYESHESIDQVIQILDAYYILIHSISVINPFTYKKRIINQLRVGNQMGFVFDKTIEQIKIVIEEEYSSHNRLLNIAQETADNIHDGIEILYSKNDKNRKPRLWVSGEYSKLMRRLVEAECRYTKQKNIFGSNLDG